MHLIPTQDEVVAVLRETGALRSGHFEYPTGLHSDGYLQVPLALRYSQHQRMLSVGLSRLLRANSELRAVAADVSIVAPATGGLPVGPETNPRSCRRGRRQPEGSAARTERETGRRTPERGSA